VFITIAVLMMAAFTYLYYRDGPPPGTGAWFSFLLGFFWLGVLAGANETYFEPRTQVWHDQTEGCLIVRELWLWRTAEEAVGAAPPVVEEERDSDGDPRYVCWLETAGGRRIRMRESAVRAEAERAREHVMAAWPAWPA